MKPEAGALVALLLIAGRAHADPEPESPPPEPPIVAATPEPRPLPDFMRNKRRMSAAGLADKRAGGYFTGLPLLNSDPDTGVGFGARVLYFDNGSPDDVLFEATPYRHALYAQAFFTSNGYQDHVLDYDAPYLFGRPYRLRANLTYEKNIAANYYGLGDRSLGRLAFPGSPGTFASQSDYTSALRALRPDGTTYTRENQYVLERPAASATVERDFFGGLVRAAVGIKLAYASVRQWTGDRVKADDPVTGQTNVNAIAAPTRLDRDCNAGLVVGCAGGFDNTLKLGVAYDTRDFEPDPTSGVFVELTGELSGAYTLSDYDWARVSFSPRVYYSPLPKLARLVIAARGLATVQSAGTPLFELDQLSFTDYDRQGLGGLRTLRGFNEDRFVGPVSLLATLELRWTFFDFTVRRNQHFGLMLVPFLDVGRVFDSVGDLELRRFRNGQGAGFRVAWNQATIIVLDYGVSREGSSLYINFNHPF